MRLLPIANVSTFSVGRNTHECAHLYFVYNLSDGHILRPCDACPKREVKQDDFRDTTVSTVTCINIIKLLIFLFLKTHFTITSKACNGGQISQFFQDGKRN